jgi:hypothetical protein
MALVVKGARWKIGVSLAVIFVAGAGLGWVAGQQAIYARQKAMSRPGFWDGMVLGRMEERLGLTPDQRATLEPLVRETAQRLQAQRRRAIQEQMQTVKGFYEQVEPHLTEEQRGRMERYRQQVRERAREEKPVLPPRPGGFPGSGPAWGRMPTPPNP